MADGVIRLHEQIAAAHAETDRVKRNLRQWQTDHAATCRGSLLRASDGPATLGTPAVYEPDPPRHPTRADWPINHS